MKTKQLEKLKRQMNLPVERGNTWVGIRPVVFGSKREDAKSIRKENKKIAREWRD